MKKLTQVTTVLGTCAVSLLLGVDARAVFDPDWERPIFKSEMRVVDARVGSQNSLAGVRDLAVTMTRRDGMKRSTGFIVDYDLATVEGPSVVPPTAPAENEETDEDPYHRSVQLTVARQEVDECNSVHYFASLPQTVKGETHSQFNLHLVDHSERTCKDQKPFQWEASVRQAGGTAEESVILTEGNPEPVVTIQGFDF